MMINSVNFKQYTNNYNVQAKKLNATIPAFGNSRNFKIDLFDYLEDIRTFDGKNQKANNIILFDRIKHGNYKEAYVDVIGICGDNFSANYTGNGYSLLQLLYSNKHPIKSLLQNSYKKALMLKIMQHPGFNPNATYTYYSKKRGPVSKTYIEDAVENNNIFLATHLCENPDLKDPYDDDFDTLISKTKNPHMKLLLYAAGLRSIIDSCNNVSSENSATDTNSNLYEADEVKKYRVKINENIPATLEDIGGLHKAKSDIQDFIIKPWSADIRCKLKENNVEMPNGFLMYGPPGCGKTYVVKVIANQTGFPMYEVDLASVGNCKAYETPKALKNIFNALESQYAKNNIPNILFLDEIDSICASRSQTGTDWKRDDINTLISLLNNASDKGIIVIGATNLIDNVDKAVLRTGRFDKKIEIPLPSDTERKDIIEKLITRKKVMLNLLPNINTLVEFTDGKSCSDIAAIVNDCARRAIYANKKNVEVKDFENSVSCIEDRKPERNLIGFHS